MYFLVFYNLGEKSDFSFYYTHNCYNKTVYQHKSEVVFFSVCTNIALNKAVDWAINKIRNYHKSPK